MSNYAQTSNPDLYFSMYHEMPAICLLLDSNLNIMLINQFGCDQLGYQPQELINQAVINLYTQDDQQFVNNNLKLMFKNGNLKTQRWECTRRRRDGSQYWVRDTARTIKTDDSDELKILIVSEDITETHYLINELEKQAQIDSLTGIFNRNYFKRHIDQAILSAKTNNIEHNLCFIDLDQFKVVNDVSGHQAGDELLRQIVTTIRNEIRAEDIFARVGGDEFGLLLSNCSFEKAYEIADKILHAIIKHHFSWQNELFNIGASIGLVTINSDSTDTESIIKMADSACYLAKEKGRKNIQVFNASDSDMQERNRMQKYASRLNWAFENNRFEIHYQKIIPLINPNSTHHIEILVRMRDEEGQLVYPGSFIPAAEYYNLSTQLDLWVTQHTLKFFHQNPQIHPFMCNINLSGKSLSSHEFINQATELIRQYDNEQLSICFEITETAAIMNMSQAIDFIHHFRKLGCLFALDDFGSGFSSFAYLKNLPIDFLKIDGYFVKNIINDSMDLALVRAIHQVAEVFGIKTIAEFVEDAETRAVLKGLGIDYGQGYHLHKPEKIKTLL